MLDQKDDEVLLGLELARQLLGRDHPDSALLGLDLLGRLHFKFFRNYRKLVRRVQGILGLIAPTSGTVRERYVFQNQIFISNYSGEVRNYSGRIRPTWSGNWRAKAKLGQAQPR